MFMPPSIVFALGLFLWVIVTELMPSCLCGKCFTDSAISSVLQILILFQNIWAPFIYVFTLSKPRSFRVQADNRKQFGTRHLSLLQACCDMHRDQKLGYNLLTSDRIVLVLFRVLTGWKWTKHRWGKQHFIFINHWMKLSNVFIYVGGWYSYLQ